MCLYILPVCMYVHHVCVCLMPMEGRGELSPCLCKSNKCFNLRVISIPLREVLISDLFQV